MNQQSLLDKNKGILNEEQKDAIVHFHITGGKTVTQTWIAKHFGVHRKTVYNVLKERGALLDKHDIQKLMGIAVVMKEHNLDAAKLREVINVPALTAENIVRKLMTLKTEELMSIVYQIIGNQFMTEAMSKEVMAGQESNNKKEAVYG